MTSPDPLHSYLGEHVWRHAQLNYKMSTRFSARDNTEWFFEDYYSHGFEKACEHIVDSCTKYFILNVENPPVELSEMERTYIAMLEVERG